VLGKAGWTKYDELIIAGVQIHFFRKPKRFGGVKKLDDKSEKGVECFYLLRVAKSPAQSPLF